MGTTGNQQTNEYDNICFIITPIGAENSPIRKKTDGLINNVIKPVCEELNLVAIPAHEIDKPGSITRQVIQHIMNSKMVVANLTGLNPNVMYELAIRHAAKLPVVCLAEEDTILPFDITTERTIFYTDDMYGAVKLIPDLKSKIKSALEDVNVDNPIYRAIKENQIIETITSSNDNSSNGALSYIINRLDKIDRRINNSNNENRYFKQLNNCNRYSLKIVLEKPICKELSEDIRSIIYNYNHDSFCLNRFSLEIIFNEEIPSLFIDQLYDLSLHYKNTILEIQKKEIN